MRIVPPATTLADHAFPGAGMSFSSNVNDHMLADNEAAEPRRGAKAAARGDRVAAIYRAILDAVIEHRLRPGTKLSEDEIGVIFGVSRTIVRAALQRLAHENILTIARNRGAFVASPTVEEALQVFEARKVLESFLARQAAEHALPADIVQLRRHLDAEIEALDRADRPSAIRLSGLLHLRIGDLSGQKVLAGFLRELVSRTSLVIALYGRSGASACGHREHVDIVAALAQGDGERAAMLMIEHLAHIEADLALDTRIRGEVDVAAVLSAEPAGAPLFQPK